MTNGLSGRAIFLGAILSALVCAYSAYAGLKIGGVYWPVVTTSLISLIVLTILGKASKNEVNLMQTAGSSGGLLAAGIIFTIPAAMLLGIDVSYVQIVVISLVGGVLGIIFSYPLRKQLIEREKLPCADGAAAAALIEAGDKGGQKAKALMFALGLGALMAILRDWFRLIPSFFNLETLKISAGKLFSWGSSVSFIPYAGGFLIGARFATAWFLGAIFTYFVLVPFALTSGMFGAKYEVVSAIARPLGVGIVLGSAIVYFIIKGMPSMRKMLADWKGAKFSNYYGAAAIVCLGALTMVLKLDVFLSAFILLGAFAVSYIAARSTGEMNVDPMEIFAMLLVLIAKIFGFGALPLILLAAVVTIAAGMAGDMMQDLKAGYILGTRLEDQIISQIVGMVAGALVIGIVLLSLQGSIGTTDFPAPQAMALKELVSSPQISEMLKYGMLIGAAITLVISKYRPDLAIAAVAFGIGIYVPIELSFPLFVGGMIRHFAEQRRLAEKGRLLAAGMIAGEGLVGVIISLIGFSAAFIK